MVDGAGLKGWLGELACEVPAVLLALMSTTAQVFVLSVEDLVARSYDMHTLP